MGNEPAAPRINEAKLDALIELMFLAAQADGVLAAQERAHLVSFVQSLTDRKLEGDKLDALLGRLETDYKKNGRDKALGSVKARLGDERSRRHGLAMAIRMIAAGGALGTGQREFVLGMADTLGVDRKVAADLVDEITG
jgi:tellurite resistance protein